MLIASKSLLTKRFGGHKNNSDTKEDPLPRTHLSLYIYLSLFLYLPLSCILLIVAQALSPVRTGMRWNSIFIFEPAAPDYGT